MMRTFWMGIAWQSVLGQVIGNASNSDVTIFSWSHGLYMISMLTPEQRVGNYCLGLWMRQIARTLLDIGGAVFGLAWC